MNKLWGLLLLLTTMVSAQIKGTIKDKDGKPMSFVNIYVEKTYNSTTSNDLGQFELNVKNPGTYSIIFQFLGFKTVKKNVEATTFPVTLSIVMEEEELQISEVTVGTGINLADGIIKNSIKNKKDNSQKTARYNADFYSRGIFRIKDAPKAILGQKFDEFDEVLDSTRSGILYLSETVSKISFQKPDKMKETIIASKVSGNDNGFSFNNAASVNFDWYDNYIPFSVNIVSPISDNAFNYYRYKLEGTFFDTDNHQINKIKVMPRRMSEPAVEGYIYIIDNSWALYAVDFTINGDQVQVPAIQKLALKQNFSYNSENRLWVKNTQTLDFTAGIFGINVSGRFTYVYNNFEFPEKFEKKTFTREILNFEADSNKKSDDFWETIRPVPLTEEESTDYEKKDILQTKKKSRVYMDSVDAKGNLFKFMNPIMGYTYKNTFEKYSISYDGLLRGLAFNTVQGWNINTGLKLFRRDDDTRTYSSFGVDANYGFAEEKLRGAFNYNQKFNNTNMASVTVTAGSEARQFNPSKPISRFVNSVSTLFFKDNYMKLYESNFASATFSQEFINGLNMRFFAEYSERKPLWNNTDYVLIANANSYTSNNPLLPSNYFTPAIERQNLVKTALSGRINFAQEYWTRPDGKVNLRNDDYPTVIFNLESGFAGSQKKLDYQHLNIRTFFNHTFGNKGNLGLNITAGKFFNADNISFIDYKHFNGNQTHIGSADRYLNVFNLMPYYINSTNKTYFEAHFEHDDKGYFTNKIPLLNKLKSSLVLGYHNLSVPDRSPYHEFTIGLDNLGFGKFKLFRFDYVHSYHGGIERNGVVFGIKILNVLD